MFNAFSWKDPSTSGGIDMPPGLTKSTIVCGGGDCWPDMPSRSPRPQRLRTPGLLKDLKVSGHQNHQSPDVT